MQLKETQLKQQQRLLKVRGFYSGPIDGLWGPETIKAMKKWEADKSFKPCIPNNGLPIRERPPYPAGVYVKQDGSLTDAMLDKEDTVKPEKKKPEAVTEVKPEE